MMDAFHVRSIMSFILLLNSIHLVCCVPLTDMYYQSSTPGDKLTCQKCQRGSYKTGDCTSDGGLSECSPCPEGSYMPVLNTDDRCIGCSQGCPGNTGATQTQIMGACNSTSDITCTCIDEHYEIDDGELCLPWNPCYPGTGVTQKATSTVDTFCEPCREGTFSNNTSLTEPCKSCRTCDATEEADPKSCADDGKSDRICVPLQNNIFPSEGAVQPTGTTLTPPWLWVGIGTGLAVVTVVVTVVALIYLARRYHVTLSDITSKLRLLRRTWRGQSEVTTPPMELHTEDMPMIPPTSTCQATANADQPTANAGQPITSIGQSTANAGQPTTSDGQSTANAGQPITSIGQSTANAGQPTTSAGQSTANAGQPITSTGQSTANAGQSTASAGQSTASAGQSTSIASQLIASAGQSTAIAGQSTAIASQSTAIASQFTDIAGQSTAIASQSTASADQSTAIADQPITSTGQSIASTGQPTASAGQPTASAGQSTASAGQPTASTGQPTASVGQPTASTGSTSSCTSQATASASQTTAVRAYEETVTLSNGHNVQDNRGFNKEHRTNVFACKYTSDSAKEEESRIWNFDVTCGSFINLRGSEIETVLDDKRRVEAYDGVGMLCYHGMSATCFRVGTKYVMTALHVFRQYVRFYERNSHGENNAYFFNGAYVIFNFLDSSNTIIEEDKYDLKPLATPTGILFYSETTDCVVLELVENNLRPLPYQFKYFSVPLLEKEFILITHSNNEVKHKDRVSVILDPRAEQTLNDIAFVERESDVLVSGNGRSTSDFKFQMDIGHPERLDNINRILFHCRSSHGGSGSPGIIVSQGRVVVVTMLLRGFPEWYYDNRCSDLRRHWSDDCRVEQGVNMISVAREMYEKNRGLYNDVFGMS